MNHDFKNLKLPGVHIESDDETIQIFESALSKARITNEEFQALKKYSSVSGKQKGFIPSKCDTMNFPSLHLYSSPETTSNFEKKLCHFKSISGEMLNYVLELKEKLEIPKNTSYKNKITMERNDKADDDEDDKNSDKTFDCSDCSINPIDDDSDLEPDIITCQFIKIRNKPLKWEKKSKTELNKLTGKTYGVDDLEDLISWS